MLHRIFFFVCVCVYIRRPLCRWRRGTEDAQILSFWGYCQYSLTHGDDRRTSQDTRESKSEGTSRHLRNICADSKGWSSSKGQRGNDNILAGVGEPSTPTKERKFLIQMLHLYSGFVTARFPCVMLKETPSHRNVLRSTPVYIPAREQKKRAKWRDWLQNVVVHFETAHSVISR